MDIAKLLIEHGADIHTGDDSLLITSCEHNDEKTVAFLLENGADAQARFNFPLLLACRQNYIGIVKLLMNAGAIIDQDVLFNAVDNNLFEMVQLFIDYGADINMNNGYILRGINSLDMLELLIKNKIDIHKYGGVQLQWSLLLKMPDVILKLLELDIYPSNLTAWLINLAAEQNCLEIIQVAIVSGVIKPPNDDELYKEFIKACHKNLIEAVKVFIVCGVDIRKNNNEALCVAVKWCYYDLIKLLLKCGANPNDRSGAIIAIHAIGRHDHYNLFTNRMHNQDYTKELRTQVLSLLLDNGANSRLIETYLAKMYTNNISKIVK